MKWWQSITAYELYPKSFKDTTGSGSGDIRGIIEKLDYLQDLGIGAVWITPVFKSPMVDNGYDVADYCDIDPSFGTMEDMEELIREADKRGIKIVLDLVYNHTSDQHKWFIESKSSKDNPKADWYIWRPAKDGKEPTNWRGIFGGSAWTWCDERQEYYLHTFASQQPDLNWANPEVRQALFDSANFWVKKGVGGFRIDAITYIKKPEEYVDGTPDGKDGMVSIHDLTANQEGILDYLKEFKKEVTEGKDIFTVAEANGVHADELKYWVGKDGAFDLLFEFSHVNLEFEGVETWCYPNEWKLTDLKKALFASQAATKNNGWYPIFFENHDKPRSASHYFSSDCDPIEAAKAIAVLQMTLRGTPFIYQGQELGYTNVRFDHIDDYDELNSKAQYEFALQEGFNESEAMEFVARFSRDNARTPMQWDDSENAGFTTGKPWLPIHKDYKTCNAKAQAADPDSVLSWYKTLSQLRKEHPELIEGDFTPILEDDENIIAYKRTFKKTCIVLVNFSNKEVEYDDTIVKNAKLLVSSKKDWIPGKLRANEAVVLEM